MAFEVTATRKRPQLFDTLVGQQFVVSTIKSGIESGKVANAYLFSGPRGVGKTSLARILAKALNCVEGPTAYPCGVCANCKAITVGSSVDVIEIDGASNTSVNDIRVIKDEILFPPTSSLYKIYIIDEVHMLSTSAFNALLKTIEEPPSYVKFIFATTEAHKVPATISSRCQQFHFQLIDIETIKESLRETAKESDIAIEEEALFWIAKEATGSLRDAYTLFDQIAAFSNDNITMALIEEKLGLAGLDKINAIFLSLVEKDKKSSLEALFALLDHGVSVEQAVKEFSSYARSLLLIKRGIKSESILGFQVSQFPQQVIEKYTSEQLEAALELFLRLYRDIRYSLNPRFELELAISRLVNLDQLVSSASLVNKIEKLKEQLGQGASFVTPTPKKEKPVIQEIAEVVEKQEEEKESPPKPFSKEILTTLIQKLSSERDQLGMILSQVVDFRQNEDSLVLVFASKFAFDSAKNSSQKIKDLIAKEGNIGGAISFERFKEEEKENEKTIEKPNDNLANTIASMFRGEIIE